MKLHKAAVFFDRDPVYDAYTGDFLFKGQFASYEGNQMDGTVQRRRVLSTAPAIAMPTRRAVSIYDEKWIVGSPLTDGWESTPIRRTTICKLATDCGWCVSAGDLLQGGPAKPAYWNAEYLKSTVNTQTTSDYSPQYRVWLGLNEKVGRSWVMKSSTPGGRQRLLLVRSWLEDPTGFLQIHADEATNSYGIEPEIYPMVLGALNPVTEQRTAVGQVRMLLVDMYKLYDYTSQYDEKLTAGDLGALAPRGSVMAGYMLELNDLTFQVLRAVFNPETQADVLHLRKI